MSDMEHENKIFPLILYKFYMKKCNICKNCYIVKPVI